MHSMNKSYLSNLWRWKCGLDENELLSKPNPISIQELQLSEWSYDFEKLMRNRLIMGAFRYGKLHAKGKPQYDRIESCIKRLRRYQETGNKEYLVDTANLCLMEFEEGNGHFESIDDDNIHCEIIK